LFLWEFQEREGSNSGKIAGAPVATLALKQEEIKSGKHAEKARQFAEKIRRA